MAADAKVDLERELGGEHSVLELLSEQECAEILTMFREARRVERETLETSIDAALSALPWPIRMPARKIMFGGKDK